MALSRIFHNDHDQITTLTLLLLFMQVVLVFLKFITKNTYDARAHLQVGIKRYHTPFFFVFMPSSDLRLSTSLSVASSAAKDEWSA